MTTIRVPACNSIVDFLACARTHLRIRTSKVKRNGHVQCQISNDIFPVVPHKAVADVSKIATYSRGWLWMVVVNHGWQSEPTDGPKVVGGCTGCSGHLTHTAGCALV